MGPSELAYIADKLAKLFPKSDWGTDMMGLLGRRCGRLDLSRDQIDAVVEEHRCKTRSRSPVLKDLIDRLHDANGKRYSDAVKVETPVDWRGMRPPVTAWNHELAARFDANPDDPVFARLAVKGISVYVATRGMRGTAKGPAEVEMARQ